MMRGLESQMRGLALIRTLAAMRTLRWAAQYEAAARICYRRCSATLVQSYSMVSWHFVNAVLTPGVLWSAALAWHVSTLCC